MFFYIMATGKDGSFSGFLFIWFLLIVYHSIGVEFLGVSAFQLLFYYKSLDTCTEPFFHFSFVFGFQCLF
jgi:hypothetical protein